MADQTRLKLKVDDTSVVISGEVVGAPDVLAHGDTIYFVGRSKVDEFRVPSKKGVIRCVYVAKGDSIIAVDEELVLDVIDDHEQQTTGQLRLLSLEGEARRAARLAVDERRRQVLELDISPEKDDAQAPDHLATKVKDYARATVDLNPDEVGDLHLYFEQLEEAWAKVAALGLAGVEQARRGFIAQLEEERRQRVAATEITVDSSGTAMTEEEVEEARTA